MMGVCASCKAVLLREMEREAVQETVHTGVASGAVFGEGEGVRSFQGRIRITEQTATERVAHGSNLEYVSFQLQIWSRALQAFMRTPSTNSLARQLNVVPMSEFALKWRFTDSKYDLLSPEHVSQIQPLDDKSAHLLWKLILDSDVHAADPFEPGFFRHVESISVGDNSHGDHDEDARIRKWLYRCAIPFDQIVYLSWQPQWAVMTTWKMLTKYWMAFYYPISDDLSIIDESLQWCVLFHHEHRIHFGTNRPRVETEEEHEGT